MTLTQRLRDCAGASREVDERIWCALNDETWKPESVSVGPDGWLVRSGYNNIPHYTGSIDAAMTLVPEGWGVETSNRSHAHPDGSEAKNGYAVVGCKYSGIADTVPLALCIAALLARGIE